MDINDIELMECLPIGIIIDSNVKSLDKFGYSFALSGIDFETCVTYACAKEILRFSPIRIVICSKDFVGGNVADVLALTQVSNKLIKTVLWAEEEKDLPSRKIIQSYGFHDIIIKTHPFSKILKKIRKIIAIK